MLGIHFKANVGIRQRLWASAAKRLLKNQIDPTFNLAEFVQGAKFAYKIVRQVAANSTRVEHLGVLEPMVSPTLYGSLCDNVQNISATQRNLSTRVQDVYAEVIELRIRLCSEEKLDLAKMSVVRYPAGCRVYGVGCRVQS